MSATSNSDATRALLALCRDKTRWSTELNAEAVKKAVAEGADVKACDTNGMTALHLAVQGPNHKREPLPSVDVVRALIEAGADVNARDKHQQTPLLRAIPFERSQENEDRALEIIRLLRASGGTAPSDVKNRNSGAFNSTSEVLYREVLDTGAAIDARDDAGETPLHWAAAMGAPASAKLLLERGADVNALDGMGRTPLGVGLRKKPRTWVENNQYRPGFIAVLSVLEAAGGKASVPFQYDSTDPFAPIPIDEAALTKALKGETLYFKDTDNHPVGSAQEAATGLYNSGEPSEALNKLRAIRDALPDVTERKVHLKGPLTLKRVFFHHGDLEVDGDLDIRRPFAVTGTVIVHGVVHDNENDSLVNILGDLKCHALHTSGEFTVGGDIEARDVVVGYYNDHLLSAATLRARVVIEDDHAFDAQVEAEHRFDINRYAQGRGEGVAAALKSLFVDEVFEADEDDGEPARIDRGALFDRISQGLPVFRS